MRRFFDSDFILSLFLSPSLSCLPVLVDLTSTANLATSKAIVYAKHVGDDILYKKNSLHFFRLKNDTLCLVSLPLSLSHCLIAHIINWALLASGILNELEIFCILLKNRRCIRKIRNVKKIYWKILSKIATQKFSPY